MPDDLAALHHTSPAAGSTACDLAEAVLAGLADAAVGLVAVDPRGHIAFVNDRFLIDAHGTGGRAVGDPDRRQCLIGRKFEGLFGHLGAPCGSRDAAARDSGTDTGIADADIAGRAHDLVWSSNRSGGWIGALVATRVGTVGVVGPPRDTDALTGLGGRAHLQNAFRRIVVGADTVSGPELGTSGPPLVALYCDLDQFKRVNDTLGHGVGDGLLRRVADRLCKAVRGDDIVCRMGGDEFAILLTGRDRAGAEKIAGRIIKLLGRPFLVDGHQLSIGVSVGLAARGPGETEADPLLQRADIALYQSKAMGRGQFFWFQEEMRETLLARRAMEYDLRRALLLEQFEVEFQPQLAFDTDRISGFEALIRWRHPDRGLVPPGAFIPVAEETGLIVGIGRWVLDTACATAAGWTDGLTIAVNVSPIQFEDPGFVDAVHAALAASGLPPDRLELELTESVLLRDEQLVVGRMARLRELGVKLSLDDFGTGYSSLNYLRIYPFDKVKIDQSFVREPHADENAHRIVQAVARLGASLGMSVLAEGVETQEQLDRIRDQGCSSAQGYLLSRPIPVSALAAYLASLAAGAAETAVSFEAIDETSHDTD